MLPVPHRMSLRDIDDKGVAAIAALKSGMRVVDAVANTDIASGGSSPRGSEASDASGVSGASTPRGRGAKPSNEQPSHFLCHYPKKNGLPCRNQIVKYSEVVCHEHMADALASVPALVTLRETVREVLIDKKTNQPISALAAQQLEMFMEAYCAALLSAHRKEEGFGSAGGSYTYQTINVFDVAYNIGIKFDCADMRVYNELVAHRFNSIDQQVAQMRTQIENLLAVRATYIPIQQLQALRTEAATLLPPAGDGDAMMEDRADSD